MDLKGTLPVAWNTFACRHQAETLHRIHQFLDGLKRKGVEMKPVNHTSDYAGE